MLLCFLLAGFGAVFLVLSLNSNCKELRDTSGEIWAVTFYLQRLATIHSSSIAVENPRFDFLKTLDETLASKIP